MRNHWLRVLLLVCVLGLNACVGKTGNSGAPAGRPSPGAAVETVPTATLPAPATAAPAVTTAPTGTVSATQALTAAQQAKPTLQPTTPAAVMEKPAGVAGGRSIGDPYTPDLGNTGYDVQHYTLRFTLDPDNPMVYARTTIDALSTLDNLGQISLDFIGFDINQLTVDGRAADFTREDDKIIINLPELRSSGQAFTVEVAYSGISQPGRSKYVYFLDQMGLTYQPKFHQIFAMSEPDGARRWYPCNDHPRDKAAFTTEITVPELMQGLSNGTLVNTQTEVPNAFPDGRAGDRYTWEMKQPMATYLATVVVGKYDLLASASPRGVKLRTYVFPEERAKFTPDYQIVANAIDWMSEKFGPYPFDEFGYAMVGATNFSMETQTMVMESSTMAPATLIHEMAHQWFGDWVSLDSWADIWRNEGFATYVTALYYARNEPTRIDRMAQGWKDDMNKNPADFPLNNPPPQEMFGPVVYEKGALLAYNLHQEMGDEAFFQGLQSYFKTYGGKSATFEEFRAEMEKAAGKSLQPVFDTWFQPGPVPVP